MNMPISRSKVVRLCSFFCFFIPGVVASKTLIFESGQNAPAGPVVSAEPVNAEIVSAPQIRTISTTDVKPVSSATSSALAEMYFMVEQLKREVSELRAVVEEQSYRLQGFEEATKRRYKDLDQRLQGLTKGTGFTQTPNQSEALNPLGGTKNDARVSTPVSTSTKIVPAVSGSEAAAVAPPTEQQKQDYAKAYALVKEKRFEEAIDALHTYIENYPEGELTGNAYYWLGEVYLVLPQLEQAKQAFLIVVNTFPKHRKVADSIFKLAVTYDRMLDPENSEKYLKMVQNQFPDSTASKLAKNYKIAR